MTNARERILANIQSGLGRPGQLEAATALVDARLADPPKNLVPARAALTDPAARLALFAEEAERVQATVARVSSLAAVPDEVARYLAASNLPPAIKAAPQLKVAPWASQPMLSVTYGIADANDATGVSQAFGGVAETGTLVFRSGPETPTTLNFLPPNHIAVVYAADIAGDYEAIWRRIRAETREPVEAATFMPRTVNWITGPSRSADIEQTLLLGAHGPLRLHIVIVDA